MKPKYIFGTLIIVAFTVFGMMSFESSMVRYVSFEEAASSGKTVQVKGARVPDTDKYDHSDKAFKFQMSDESGMVFNVVYNGVKPSNFEMAKEIVARGRYANNTFYADDLLVKCPSKYEAEGVMMGAES